MMKFKPVVKQDEIIDLEKSLTALLATIAEIKGFDSTETSSTRKDPMILLLFQLLPI
jgi:hypothetical protein